MAQREEYSYARIMASLFVAEFVSEAALSEYA